jgi:hypothetical protein
VPLQPVNMPKAIDTQINVLVVLCIGPSLVVAINPLDVQDQQEFQIRSRPTFRIRTAGAKP